MKVCSKSVNVVTLRGFVLSPMPPLATNMALFPGAWLATFMALLAAVVTCPEPGALSAFDGSPRDHPGRLSSVLEKEGIICDSFDVRNSAEQDCTLASGRQVFLHMLATLAEESLSGFPGVPASARD